MGPEECNRIAQSLGVPVGAFNMAGAEALPKRVGLLTADNRTPVSLPPSLSVLLQDARPAKREGRTMPPRKVARRIAASNLL